MDRDTALDVTSSTLATADGESAPCAMFARFVRHADLGRFYSLHERNQERIKKLFGLFEIIQGAPTLDIGYTLASAAANGERGYSPKNLRTLYRRWRKCPDWRELIDQALEWRPNQAHPEDFIQWLCAEVDKNSRSINAALKKIRREWTLGKHIPGYGTWKEWYQRNHPGRPLPRIAPPHPPGWSLSTLGRAYDSSRFRRKAVVQGRTAATAHRPTVLTTRLGCWVHSHLMWDDVWHNHFINSLAEGQAGRPLELFSHDYYSARKVRWGFRVRTEDDTGKAQGLTGKMMRMIAAATYFLDGYSPRGTVNMVEHGTAAFSEAMERILYDATGGLVTVDRSGMSGNPAHLGQYHGRRIGNPRFKASLESSNNLMQNLEAYLPGQTGPDRQRRPEQLDGMLKYNERLLIAMQQLSPERAALLQFPFLDSIQYHGVLSEIYGWMESDPDHGLVDWEACGHMTADLLLPGGWMSQADVMRLDDGQRQMALAMLQAGAVKTKPRKLSRREVWDMGAAHLIKIHGGTVCELLGDEFAAERKVRGHQFCFEDREVGPGEHRFEAIITDVEGRRSQLKDGEIYKAFVNPFAADQLFVTDARGRYLGTAPRIHRYSAADVEGIKHAMGHARAVEAELLEPLRIRSAKAAREKLAMHKHNAGVLKGAADAKRKTASSAAAALGLAARRKQFSDQATTTHQTTTPADHGKGYK